MTSYASATGGANNSKNVTATATATCAAIATAAGTATSAGGDNSSETTSGVTAMSLGGGMAPPTHLMSTSESHSKQLAALQDLAFDYDCDSLSDEREKADTTPENVRKIDDVIAASACVNDTVIECAVDDAPIGLAVAIDGTNAKFCLGKPIGRHQLQQNSHQYQQQQPHLSPRQRHHDRDFHCKNEFIESSTISPTTTIAAAPMKTSLVDGIDGCGDFVVDGYNHNSYFANSHNYNNKDSNNMGYTSNDNNSGHQINRSDDGGGDDSSASNTTASISTTTAPAAMGATIETATTTRMTTKGETVTAAVAGGASPSTSDGIDEGDGSDEGLSQKEREKERQSYAFTIDNFGAGESDPATTAAKYKSMLERFQNRHKRGASMSKLESESVRETAEAVGTTAAGTPVSSTHSSYSAALSVRNARNAERAQQQQAANMAASDGFDVKVKLRPRDRSTSRVRDASKRHSWSPRSSTTQEVATTNAAASVAQTPTEPTSAAAKRGVAKARRATPVASTATTPTTAMARDPHKPAKVAANAVTNRSAQPFTPRSMAMQLALQKVDFLCPQPPLVDFKELRLDVANGELVEDNVSDTGTYTLDGDNYTEEQKDLMNIDRSARERERRHQEQLREQSQRQHRPRDLKLGEGGSCAPAGQEPSKIPRPNNVLEVNYYHDAGEAEQCAKGRAKPQAMQAVSDLIMGGHNTAGAYLENIKSRMLRTMSASKGTPTALSGCDDIGSSSPRSVGGGADPDLGCFTSVTTSGVLAKQSALDPRPKLTRRSSLSTSQIDSSEYVSNEAKLKSATSAAYAAGGFTDHQKAEYRLNVFTNQKDSHSGKFAATRHLIESPPDTPTSKHSDAGIGALKTAQTKNDWIQEWARNARARSLASEAGTAKGRRHHHHGHGKHSDPHELMTRSYTCAETGSGTGADSLTDDSIYSKQCAAAAALKLNKTLAERYRLAAGGDCDYANSDPALSTHSAASAVAAVLGACKPPKSPSKIPSPLHSLGRVRSASRTRASLQNMLMSDYGDLDDDDDGLASEAAVAAHADEHDIYLQKTAAAINSLQQSLSRKNSLQSPTHHSASPRAHQHRSPLHQRSDGYGGRGAYAPPLMTSSINEQQLQLLTSGEYLAARQMRARKNSFDGNIDGGSPARRSYSNSNNNHNNNTSTSRGRSGGGGGGGGGGDAEQNQSPLRRSSSFSAKVATQRAARPQFQNLYTPPAARHNYVPPNHAHAHHGHGYGQLAIKKSASSNNFGGHDLYSDYDEHLQYYINDEDDDDDEDDLEYYSSGEEGGDYYRDEDCSAGTVTAPAVAASGGAGGDLGVGGAVPLSNTRYNKALLMRIERSKQKVAGATQATTGKVSSAPPSGKVSAAAALAAAGGVIACPNTPELPRRGGIRSAPRVTGGGSARQSMPRDTSLSRLATQVPSSLASAKKQLLQTAAAVPAAPKLSQLQQQQQQRVQPKYLDISKYKPAQGNSFLRKNDAKSTLMKLPAGVLSSGADAMKRSPSSSSMGLSRADPTRTSNRSVRSVASCMNTSLSSSVGSARASSAARRDASAAKQKEAEMAMWKRRSTYDPMRAAAEDRRRKEEAKRLALAKSAGGGEVPFESGSSCGRTYSQQNSICEQHEEPDEEEEDDDWTLGESENAKSYDAANGAGDQQASLD